MTRQAWRVLIADDDPTVALLAQAALAGPAFKPMIVSSGSAALAAFRCEHFDIVLLDVEMPGMDGLEVGAVVRRLRGKDFPLVLATGRDDAEFFERLHSLGATHLAKPIDWRGLPDFLMNLPGIS